VEFNPNEEAPVSANPTYLPGPQPGEHPGIERRSAYRYPILQRCFVRPPAPPEAVRAGRTGSAGPGDTEAWRCIAYNISLLGIGITMPFQPPLGTVLEVQAWESPASRPLRVRVVRTAEVEFLWFCGCELLTPLDDAELQVWVAQPQNWVPVE
jgi:hypothetical protein